MSLHRFKDAQQHRRGGFATALDELRAGRKRSHWIWYIFPQLAGLGRSSTAQYYGLPDVAAARDYLADPILRERLQAVTAAVAERLAHGTSLRELMGGEVDSMKLVSSLTLFEAVARQLMAAGKAPELAGFAGQCGEVLRVAAAQGFARCAFTLQQIEAARKNLG